MDSFAFVVCQQSAERPLKTLAIETGLWRLAFSRPGLLTMKFSGPPEQFGRASRWWIARGAIERHGTGTSQSGPGPRRLSKSLGPSPPKQSYNQQRLPPPLPFLSMASISSNAIGLCQVPSALSPVCERIGQIDRCRTE